MNDNEWAKIRQTIEATFRSPPGNFWEQALRKRDHDRVYAAIVEAVSDPQPPSGLNGLQRVLLKLRAADEAMTNAYRQPATSAPEDSGPTAYERAIEAVPYEIGEGLEAKVKRRAAYLLEVGLAAKPDTESASEAVAAMKALAEQLGVVDQPVPGKPWTARGTKEAPAPRTAEQIEKRSWWRVLFADNPGLRFDPRSLLLPEKAKHFTPAPPREVTKEDRRLAAAYERRMRSQVEGWTNPYGKGGA